MSSVAHLILEAIHRRIDLSAEYPNCKLILSVEVESQEDWMVVFRASLAMNVNLPERTHIALSKELIKVNLLQLHWKRELLV